MAPDPAFFHDLAYVFAAAVLGGALAWALRQPLILGYVLGGILIGPFTPGPAVSDVHTFELFADIGVVLLMFSIGIEFSLRDLLRVKWVALLGAPLGMLLSIAAATGLGAVLGWPLVQSLSIGAVVSVASTMVVARLLVDRGELQARHGRIMIGIALVEDLAVVLLTVLLPAVGGLERGEMLAVGVALARATVILVPFVLLAAKVVPSIMGRVARTGNEELFLMVALAIGLGTAALTQAVGLSLALGAFLGGLVISDSDYAHEALARLLPLRDVFVAMFFVTIGILIDPATVVANLPLLGAIGGLVLVGNFLIWTLVVLLFGYPLSTALMVGIGLAQIGEFSFVLVQVARTAGHVGDDVYNATLAASLLTILLNAPLVRYVPRWLGALKERRAREAVATGGAPPRADHVLLCGFGRVGSAIGEALDTFGIPYAVIELNADIATGLRARGIPCLFGDAAHRGHLVHSGADRASLVIVALPEVERARLVVRAVRGVNPGVPILARAHGGPEAERLREVGATEIIQPEVEAAATLIRHALRRLALPKERALAYLERYRGAMEPEAVTAPAAPSLPEVREVVLPDGRLAGLTLREAQVRERFGVTVVGITRRDSVVHNPSPDTRLRAGDTVKIFGLPEQVDSFVTAASQT
jgi:CPA2 family monovalent cation:H+ antiporter-2